MASKTYLCPCLPSCNFFSECAYIQDVSLEAHYSQLKLSEKPASVEPKSVRAELDHRPFHNFPDQYTVLTTEVPLPISPPTTSSSNAGISPAPPSLSSEIPVIEVTDAETEELQEREEHLIEKYHVVFEMLENQYRQLEGELKRETGNTFGQSVVRAVMASIRECMAMNELAMLEGRRALWEGYRNDEISQPEDEEVTQGYVEEIKEGDLELRLEIGK